MIKEIQLRVMPFEAANEQKLRRIVSRETSVGEERISAVRILRRSIDARRRAVAFNLRLRVFIDEEPTDELFEPITYPDVSGRPQAVVV